MPSDKDCCSAVEAELVKVESRVQSVSRMSQETLGSCIDNVTEIQQELANRQTGMSCQLTTLN